MLTEIKLVHTPRSDGKLYTLRAHVPEGYGAPTWSAVFRLLHCYATNPGKLNGGKVKSLSGWEWVCMHCGRATVGKRDQILARCKWCKCKSLFGREAPEFMLSRPTGQDYFGGIDLAEFVADWSLWVLSVVPDPRAFRAAECWARGLGSHRQAQYSGCSQRYALLSVDSLRRAYDERRIG